MARESRFGLFLAAVMFVSLAVAASADPKPRAERAAGTAHAAAVTATR